MNNDPKDEAIRVMALVSHFMNPHDWLAFEQEMLETVAMNSLLVAKPKDIGRAVRLIAKMEELGYGVKS